MRSKILFIVPPCVSADRLIPDKNRFFSGKIRKEVPLGALSLASYVQKHTCAKAVVLDLNLRFWELVNTGSIDAVNTPESHIRRMIGEFKNEKFDLCRISAIFTPAYSYIELISRIVKETFPDAFVVTGGVASSLIQETFRDCQCVDAISYGEGEIGIAGLIAAENEERYLQESASMVVRGKTEYSFEFVEDLDEIPPLDFSLIEFEKYSGHVHVQDNKKVVTIPLMFSRGCPFNCCFCASHSVHGKRVRYNSMGRIKSDIGLFAEKYGINTITVWDDNFFVDKGNAIDLLDYFEELGLNVEFVNGFPVYRMDDDMAARLKKSGVDVVTLAIESGNPRVLKDIIHKPLRLEMVPEAISCLHKHDIYVKGLFVIGFPGETIDDIQMTMDFIQESELNWVDIYIASPLPGSELYEICREGGYLKNDILDSCDYWCGNIETEFFNAAQIEEIQLYNMLKKDFVNNLDMKNKRWERALANFEYVINAGHGNPFAYYYAASAAMELGDGEKADRYYREYMRIREESDKWEKMFQKFSGESEAFPRII